MNYAHIHIVLNHFPTIGTVIGASLFAYALWRRNEELKNIGFVIFMLMSLLTIPTFITGAAADQAIAGRSELDTVMVDLHQSAAILASATLFLTGTFAWLALWQVRRYKIASSWTSGLVMVLSVLTIGLMMQTGSLGGEISHLEIRAEGAPNLTTLPGDEVPLAISLQNWVINSSWVWPAGETLHFTGMTLLFGVAFVINLRLFGLIRDVPFTSLHRLLPIGILGFGVSLVSGMLLFNANFPRYVNVPTFFLKMLFVVLAGISVLYVTLFDSTWTLEGGNRILLRHKVFAVTTTLLLIGALYFGRMIPFLE
jgi:hypothetical protein